MAGGGPVRLLLCALALGASSSVEADPGSADEASGSLQVTAERVTVEGDRVRAEGQVVLAMRGQRCVAERLEQDRASGRLTLERGACDADGGDLAFERAVVDLAQGTAVAYNARLDAGGLLVTADRVTRLADGTLSAEQAFVSWCSCTPAPWSVEARELELILDDRLRFSGGWIRVCERRVLPLPRGSLPLTDRRSGLLVPRAGWGRDGLILAQPAQLTLGPSADLWVEPEWRQDRGLRASGEARLALRPEQSVEVAGFGGYDRILEKARGQVGLQEAFNLGPLSSAASGAWLSDAGVIADYGDAYLDRAAPWVESRARVGAGPLRVETDRYQPLQGQVLRGRALSVVLADGGRRLGPAALSGALRLDSLGWAAGGLAVADPQPRIYGRGDAVLGHSLGPSRWVAQAGGRLLQQPEQATWLEGRLQGQALLDLWGDVGGMRHLAALGLQAGLARDQGPVDIRLPGEAPTPDWQLGPTWTSRLVGAQGVPLSAALRAPYGPQGWDPSGNARLRLGSFEARIQADAHLQGGALAWRDGLHHLGLRLQHRGALLQGGPELGWQLPGPVAGWELGYRGLFDLQDRDSLSQQARLGWRSACDCLSARLGATWSADRRVPDLGLQVELR